MRHTIYANAMLMQSVQQEPKWLLLSDKQAYKRKHFLSNCSLLTVSFNRLSSKYLRLNTKFNNHQVVSASPVDRESSQGIRSCVKTAAHQRCSQQPLMTLFSSIIFKSRSNTPAQKRVV